MTNNNRIHLNLRSKLVEATGISDIGLKRKENEDTIYFDESGHLFLVADGMGGLARGKQASQTAISLLAKFLDTEILKRECQENDCFLGVPPSLARYLPYIYKAISDTNLKIYSGNNELEPKKHTGTTIVGLSLVDDDHALRFHVGDSCVYRWRNGKLEKLTQDHSLHALWVEYGKTAMEPNKSILTQALGSKPEVAPDIAWDRKEKGDVYILCSDGLTSMVDDKQIEEIVQGSESKVDWIADNLLDGALENGGDDNISIIVCKVRS